MRILVATSVRNEGPFLVEWIAWMRLIGVTDFIVVANDCTDGSDRLLAALDAAGVIHYLPHEPAPGKSVQWQALQKAWRHPLRKSADWMLIADVDEFPMIHAGQHRLADLFAAIPEDTDAITLPWRFFGDSGIVGIEDRPTTAQFTHCAPADLFHPIAATFFKTLFRPQAFQRFGIHRPRQKDGQIPNWIDGSGNSMAPAFAGNDKRMSLLGHPLARNLVELHHYSVRSAASFIVKSARGLPNRVQKNIDLAYWVERNYNNVENTAAHALQRALLAEIASLASLPEISALHQHCLNWHREEFERLMLQMETYSLFNHCLHAGGSRPLPPDLARNLLARFHRVRQNSDS